MSYIFGVSPGLVWVPQRSLRWVSLGLYHTKIFYRLEALTGSYNQWCPRSKGLLL